MAADQYDDGQNNPAGSTAPPGTTGGFKSLAYRLPDGTAVYQDAQGNLFTNDNMGPNGPSGNWTPYTGTLPKGAPLSTPPGSYTPGGQDPTPNPAPAPPPSGGADAPPDSQFPPWTTPWTPPEWEPTPDAPTFKAPEWKAPPAFSFGDFKAPTADEALTDPGYQFRTDQGRQALQRAGALKGITNTGMNLRDILDYGQNAASQEYQNVYNRDASSYQMNRSNAVDQYNTNYATQYVDPYKYTYQAALDTFNPSFDAWKTNAGNLERKNELGTNNSLKYYEDQYNAFLNEQRDRWGRARDVLGS